MDENKLIEEVIRELKKKLEKKCSVPFQAKKALVIGSLNDEEQKILKTSYSLVPFTESEQGDVIIIARLSLSLMAELALGLPVSKEASAVLYAILCKKEVYLLEEGIEYRKYKETAVKTLYHLYQGYEDSILKHGAQLLHCTADIRKEVEKDIIVLEADYIDLTKQKLLRESDLMKAKNKGYITVLLDSDAIITPLASDYIANHNLFVRRTAKR